MFCASNYSPHVRWNRYDAPSRIASRIASRPRNTSLVAELAPAAAQDALLDGLDLYTHAAINQQQSATPL